jgi:peptide deformylase
MKKYELKYYGDPVLRKKAKPVEKITPEIIHLVQSMIELMEKHNGCGLAATQVGELYRIFVSNVEYEDDNGEVHLGEPRVYINPVLSDPSEIYVERGEACLSIPKLYLPVERPLEIKVTALDLEGNTFTRECKRFLARNMMHENDHLNGVLFIDRVKGKLRTEAEPYLRKIKQQYN